MAQSRAPHPSVHTGDQTLRCSHYWGGHCAASGCLRAGLWCPHQFVYAGGQIRGGLRGTSRKETRHGEGAGIGCRDRVGGGGASAQHPVVS